MSIFSKISEKGKNYVKQKYGVDVKPVEETAKVEKLYSIYDKICGEYNPPFVCKNMATAIRNMRDSLKDAKQSIIAMHPEDYVLYEIGTFDKDTGLVLHCDDFHWQSFELVNLFKPLDNKEIKKDDEIQNK